MNLEAQLTEYLSQPTLSLPEFRRALRLSKIIAHRTGRTQAAVLAAAEQGTL